MNDRLSEGHNDLEALAAVWRRAKNVCLLTGAGVSTASGIPDFRSPGGRWSSYQPITIQEFRAEHSSRVEYWRYKGETWQLIREAPVNPAHQSLTQLALAGQIHTLVTQNVDGLHERSGFPPDRLIHIHGTDSQVQCLDCHRVEPREQAQRQWEAGIEVPLCPCGEPWKPATISFGQQLVMDDLQRAFDQATDCHLLVAVGTSLVVSPICRMFDSAAAGRAQTAILTASQTPYDELADFKLNQPLEELLPRLAAAILRP